MRYALLLYADVAAAQSTTHGAAEAELARYLAITQELATDGVLRGGEAFLPASTGRQVALDGDEVRVDDVPAVSRELSGFFLVECDEDRAVEIAAGMPVAAHGHVEVRPLMDMPAPG